VQAQATIQHESQKLTRRSPKKAVEKLNWMQKKAKAAKEMVSGVPLTPAEKDAQEVFIQEELLERAKGAK
jgi:hypothetical protein